VLSVACDNVSPNDMMINELMDLLAHFPGPANCIHCFLHIINLIAPKILKQFDLPKTKSDESETDLDRLAGDIEKEELEMREGHNSSEDDDDAGVFGLPDNESMSEDVQLMHKVLNKISPQPC